MEERYDLVFIVTDGQLTWVLEQRMDDLTLMYNVSAINSIQIIVTLLLYQLVTINLGLQHPSLITYIFNVAVLAWTN